MVNLTLEDFGTLLTCATRYGQASDVDTHTIVKICKKHINKQSLKTLNICLRDKKFFAWLVKDYPDDDLWNDWYECVKAAKKVMIYRYIQQTGLAVNRMYKCFNVYTFYKFLEQTCGVDTDVSSEEISAYIDKHNCYNSMDIIFERVGAKAMQQYINDYIDCAVDSSADDQRWLSDDFEEWAWKDNRKTYKVAKKDFNALSVYALRYCMGRCTYMPSLVRDDIVTPHLAELDDKTLAIMLEDTAKQKASNSYGDERIDKPAWIAWVNTLQNEINERKEA